MPSLLHTEAIARASLITVTSMEVSLDLTDHDRFTSHTRIRFDAARVGAQTFADFKGRELVGATLNGDALAPDCWADERIALSDLRAHNELVVDGVMEYGHDGEGLHQHDDPADGCTYLYAMSFLDAAPRWFACFDQPDLKSPYRFDVRVPGDWTVWGNGRATQVEPGRWTLEQRCPLSTYYVTLAAGPWAIAEGEHDGIRYAVLARRSLAQELHREADDILEVTAQCFDAYHTMFTQRYPYGDYVQAFVPDFNAGAMENPGCITLRDQMLLKGTPTRRQRADRASVIAHEMAHQWFGDLVTMRWWDDLWLNESFAEYLGHRVCSHATQYDVWTAFGVVRKVWGAVADQGPNTHPVAGNGADDALGALSSFDGISYAKGASVLRQLVVAMGDDVFLRGLNAYFAQHRFANAASHELFQAWTDAGAVGLDGLAQAWLQTCGMDLIRMVPGPAPQTWQVEVTPASTPVRTHAIEVAELAADGSLVRTDHLVVGPGVTPLDGVVPAGHVLVPGAHDQTWARLRPSSWALPTGVAATSTRAVLLEALTDAVRGGELAIGDALALLQAGLPGEPDDDIATAALQFAGHLAQMWSDPGLRAGRRAQVAQLAQAMMDAARPGSDRQLLCARALAQLSDDTGMLGSWLDGSALPLDLRVDDALRWALVRRLVTLGQDPSLIDGQLGRDDTASGHEHAAAARACVPTPQAKREALDAILQPSERRAYEIYEIAQALWTPEQTDLCAPLLDEYFAGIGATASFRQGWALARVAQMSFPRTLACPRTLALARGVLADPELNDRVRRELAEGVDMLERILAAQALGDVVRPR